ncbi:hypothetical protein SKAU_G00115210 [Synaphobranchus kaupii]|uniref:Uncharacterized protein n=1 Tax=Synaphobranchus kaupii TaxID=118154 RepID=A0A9Q1J1X6_SYNKA|nr:hypothetical protein SKAU_G00115210 [Synaphobranchus kaupii]
MQTGVCLRRDTETTLPELTEQHKIRQKEEQLSGLESVHMAETECAAPGLNTLEPECVTANRGQTHVARIEVNSLARDLLWDEANLCLHHSWPRDNEEYGLPRGLLITAGLRIMKSTVLPGASSSLLASG